jgi:hypothetical protein
MRYEQIGATETYRKANPIDLAGDAPPFQSAPSTERSRQNDRRILHRTRWHFCCDNVWIAPFGILHGDQFFLFADVSRRSRHPAQDGTKTWPAAKFRSVSADGHTNLHRIYHRERCAFADILGASAAHLYRTCNGHRCNRHFVNTAHYLVAKRETTLIKTFGQRRIIRHVDY